jgi:UDP-N-acetylglucosamine 2-epimerase (non-hydrolysing)
VIDALLFALGKIKKSPALLAEFRSSFDFLDERRRLILVTGHRRENLGSRMEDVCQALSELAARQDVQIVFPVHLNPQVQTTVRRALQDTSNVTLLDPLEYLPFVYLMERANLIISDSGGVQEEAPALGKPVLVTRDTTERPEAVMAGTAKLVGTSSADIVREANKLLDDAEAYDLMARARNPFGDGRAAERIVSRLTAMDPRS